MDRKLIEAIVEAFQNSDAEHENDIEPYSYYEEKAKAAITAYETYTTTPREPSFHVEGLVFL